MLKSIATTAIFSALAGCASAPLPPVAVQVDRAVAAPCAIPVVDPPALAYDQADKSMPIDEKAKRLVATVEQLENEVRELRAARDPCGADKVADPGKAGT